MLISYLRLRVSLQINRLKQNKIEENAGTVAGYMILFLIVSVCSYFLLKFSAQDNKTIVTLSVFSILMIISIPKTFNVIYQQYFESLDREILLYIPISHSAVVLIRYVEALLNLFKVYYLLYLPLLVTLVFSGNITILSLLFCIIGLLPINIIIVSLLKILIVISFWVSRGKNIKSTVLTLSGVITAIVYIIIIFFSSQLTQIFETKTPIYKFLLIPIELYANFLSESEIRFYITCFLKISLISIAIFGIAYFLTIKALINGMLVESKEIGKEDSRISSKKKLLSQLFIQYLPSISQKDIRYLFRSFENWKGVVFPIFLCLLYEYKFDSIQSKLGVYSLLAFLLIWIALSLSFRVIVLEGGCFYLLYNSPIKYIDILKEKVLTVLLITFPILFLVEITLFIVHKWSLIDILFSILWSLITLVLCSVFCISTLLKEARFETSGIQVDFRISLKIFLLLIFSLSLWSLLLYGEYYVMFNISGYLVLRFILSLLFLITGAKAWKLFVKKVSLGISEIKHDIY
ncbi:hypothetical protein [Paenibacillus marchantiophytorum]|uniref:hypothetical protein n=1 Tax=Paenibacillus marchantiophytorum TaxID=1619310 RepID=UPI0016651FAD|nr:hypothetical protein [Paenibacillus marchantiophytorum]